MELEEHQNHLSRLLANSQQEVMTLEQNFAKIEKELHIKEEKWRQQDNERMKLYYQFKVAQDSDRGPRGTNLPSSSAHESFV